MSDMKYAKILDDDDVIHEILKGAATLAKEGHEVTVWFNRNGGSNNFIVNVDGAETMYCLMTEVELRTKELDNKVSIYNRNRSKETWPSNALSTVRDLEAAVVDLRIALAAEMQKEKNDV